MQKGLHLQNAVNFLKRNRKTRSQVLIPLVILVKLGFRFFVVACGKDCCLHAIWHFSSTARVDIVT